MAQLLDIQFGVTRQSPSSSCSSQISFFHGVAGIKSDWRPQHRAAGLQAILMGSSSGRMLNIELGQGQPSFGAFRKTHVSKAKEDLSELFWSRG